MNISDLIGRLSAEQKQRLMQAKTQEDLNQLFTPDNVSLSDDQLDDVAGGIWGCFHPSAIEEDENEYERWECPTCLRTGIPGTTCGYCGNYIPE